jgi:hypothetical protein
MHFDHTLEQDKGAATPTDHSVESPSADRSGARHAAARRLWEPFGAFAATLRPRAVELGIAFGTRVVALWAIMVAWAAGLAARADRLWVRVAAALAPHLAKADRFARPYLAPVARLVRPHLARVQRRLRPYAERFAALPAVARVRTATAPVGKALANRGPARFAAAAGLLVCLGLAVATGASGGGGTSPGGAVTAEAALERASADRASRGDARGAVPAQPPAAQPPAAAAAVPPAAVPPAAVPPAAAPPAVAAPAAPAPAAAPAAPPAAAPAPKPAAPKAPAKPRRPAPVAGLTQVQMDNAYSIVKAGQKHKLPKRAMVIAVATAMQESTLLNRASDVLPESYGYKHQGTGSDHDSVGLFQQRTSAGWGSVRQLMNPEFAATAFYKALVQVPGWQSMRLTDAAQAVQYSAFGDFYQQHEAAAQAVVNACT